MDPIQRAVKDFSKLYDLVEQGFFDKNVGRSFRARARSMPDIINDVGLVPALSFCFANATKSMYDKVIEIWRKGCEEPIKAEEGGYALYLLLVLSYLRDVEILKVDISRPVEALGELVSVQTLAAKLLAPYCIQLKRLAEAVYGER